MSYIRSLVYLNKYNCNMNKAYISRHLIITVVILANPLIFPRTFVPDVHLTHVLAGNTINTYYLFACLIYA